MDDTETLCEHYQPYVVPWTEVNQAADGNGDYAWTRKRSHTVTYYDPPGILWAGEKTYHGSGTSYEQIRHVNPATVEFDLCFTYPDLS